MANETDKGAKMLRRSFLMGFMGVSLAACTGGQPANLGPDGLPLPQVYRISDQDTGQIQFRMLDGLNALRQAAGTGPVSLDAQLNAAAATHSRDMSVQNRPWHFGSDGSSPLDRLRRVGYTQMGFSWFQEGNGKIWWTLVLADSTRQGAVAEANPVPLQ